jgi:molybdopterin converting factor subunit 1
MAKFKVRAFGVTKEIVGGKDIVVEAEGKTVAELRSTLYHNYPQLQELRSLFIAVNHSYAEDAAAIAEMDEIALIPPVSGG